MGTTDLTGRAGLARHEALSSSASTLSTSQAAFEVTTLADVVDATDGLLSLREAVDLANGAAGADTITFADSLRGGTITIQGPGFDITDDLVIDGDPNDGGFGGITLTDDGGLPASPYLFKLSAGVALELQDLTIQDTQFLQPITGDVQDNAGTELHLARSKLTSLDTGFYAPAVSLLDMVTVVDSELSDNFGGGASANSILVERSYVGGNVSNTVSGLDGGTITVIDSTINNNSGDLSALHSNGGEVRIIGSIISNNVNGAGAVLGGSVYVLNSSLVDNTAASYRGGAGWSGGINGYQVELINSTITGNVVDNGRPDFSGGVGATELIVSNSIIVGNLRSGAFSPNTGDDQPPSAADIAIADNGAIISNGANIFGQAVVAGAAPSDLVGITADQIFALTVAKPGTGLGTPILAGVAADNGGPTWTVALLDDPANPALDAADPASAPPTDQRGFARDATPDIGAFELSNGIVVTTLADVVDATDGLVSLREAVELANSTAGADTITFADALRGGTIAIAGGGFAITDDLVIDGDPLDGGFAGITLTGDGVAHFGPLFALDASVTLEIEDLTIRDFAHVNNELTFIHGEAESALGLSRVRITDIESLDSPNSPAISTLGDLALTDSEISNVFGGGASADTILVERGYIANNVSDSNGGLYGRSVTVIDSTITGNRGDWAAVNGREAVQVSGSTIAGNTNGAGAINGSAVEVINSSVVDNASIGLEGALWAAGVNGGRVELVNATITGNTAETHNPDVTGGVFAGELHARNAIVVGNLRSGFDAFGNDQAPSVADIAIENDGAIISNGANIFGQSAVAGAAPTDLLGVTADQVFAQTVAKPGSGLGTPILAGVLADNGGLTQTVALLDDPANPALNAANPADAPALDQRGLARDATPDIGAFELGGEPPLPPAPPLPDLIEKQPLADADILGAPRQFFVLGEAGDAVISFVDEYAGFQSSLGAYLIGENGEILDTRWLFARIEHAEASDLASTSARPGGGPLSPGDAIALSDLFDPADLLPGTEFGLFLVADGAARNAPLVYEGGTLEFRSGGDPATVTDRVPELVHIAENGVERTILGDIMHTVDAGSPNPLSNRLNPGGEGQVTSGLLDGAFVVAFEDKPLATGDRDFNDALFAVDLLDDGTDLFTGVASGPAALIASAPANLDTLLTTAETV